MFGNLVGLIVLIALAIGFAWLTRRAWRSAGVGKLALIHAGGDQ